MTDKQQLLQEKREARRKRRIRNQVLAYIVLLVIILVAAAGVVYGVGQLADSRQEVEQETQESQEKLDEILAEEEVIATPAPTPEIVELTPEEKLDEMIDELIGGMSLEDKVAGLFIVTPEAITGVSAAVRAGEGTQQALEKYAVGGLIYFQKNIQSEEQLKEMLGNTRQYARYPVFLAVDEEGGSVARVASAGIGPVVNGAGTIGATGDANNAYQAGVTIGSTLAELGFNLNFAPVADITNVENSIMEGRSYGADATVVSGFVASMVTGLKEQKVTACLKHFPGLGCTTEDTHNGLAFTDRTEEQFWAEEITVFQAGIDAGANMVMIGHLSAPNLTGNNDPCIFSEKLVTNILREQMGYEGVIITDALNMGAISNYYGADEAAIMAIRAGCDMLLMPESFELAYSGVLRAVLDGTISEERIDDSLRRIYRIKYADQTQE